MTACLKAKIYHSKSKIQEKSEVESLSITYRSPDICESKFFNSGSWVSLCVQCVLILYFVDLFCWIDNVVLKDCECHKHLTASALVRVNQLTRGKHKTMGLLIDHLVAQFKESGGGKLLHFNWVDNLNFNLFFKSWYFFCFLCSGAINGHLCTYIQ